MDQSPDKILQAFLGYQRQKENPNFTKKIANMFETSKGSIALQSNYGNNNNINENSS